MLKESSKCWIIQQVNKEEFKTLVAKANEVAETISNMNYKKENALEDKKAKRVGTIKRGGFLRKKYQVVKNGLVIQVILDEYAEIRNIEILN